MRAYTDAFATPRDAYILDVCVRVTVGEGADAHDTAPPPLTGADAPKARATARVDKGEASGESEAPSIRVESGFETKDSGRMGLRRGRRRKPGDLRNAGGAGEAAGENHEDASMDARSCLLPASRRDAHLLDSAPVRTFLASATELFKELFREGIPEVPAASDISEEAQQLRELVHASVLERWRDTAQLRAGTPKTKILNVLDARIVDSFGVWDGTSNAGDLENEQAFARRLGNSIAIQSHPRPTEPLYGIARNFMHFFQLLPVRSVVSQVTVAFVCSETGGAAEAAPSAPATAAVTVEPSAGADMDTFLQQTVEPPPGSAAYVPLPADKWLVISTPRHHEQPHAQSSASASAANTGTVLEVLHATGLRRAQPAAPLPTAFAIPQRGSAGEMHAGQTPPPPASDASPSTAPSERITVHTVTFEARADTTWEPPFKFLKFILPTSLKCSHGWKIVDVDGHMLEGSGGALPSFSKLVYKATELANKVARSEMMESIDEIRAARPAYSSAGGLLRRSLLPAFQDVFGAFEQVGNVKLLEQPMVGKEAPLASALAHLLALMTITEDICAVLEGGPDTPPWQRRLELERECTTAIAGASDATSVTHEEMTILERARKARLLLPSAVVYEGSPATTLVGGTYLLDPYQDGHALSEHFNFFMKHFGMKIFGLQLFLTGRSRFLITNNEASNLRVEVEVMLQAISTVAGDVAGAAGLMLLAAGPSRDALAHDTATVTQLHGAALALHRLLHPPRAMPTRGSSDLAQCISACEEVLAGAGITPDVDAEPTTKPADADNMSAALGDDDPGMRAVMQRRSDVFTRIADLAQAVAAAARALPPSAPGTSQEAASACADAAAATAANNASTSV